MNIRKIEAKLNRRKRVAAYVRVSTNTEEQEESFHSQFDYYSSYISCVPDWDPVGVYSDEGLSGLSAEKRPGFMRLIEDAEAGLIDLILVKSISRFGRNAMETQIYVHRLKALNVEVQFQREGISSFEPHAEMVFNFLVSVAQEESKTISNNVKWSYKRKAEQGIRHLGNNRVLGYNEVDGELVPNDDAWIIKLIFTEYADGKSVREIAEELIERGAKTLRGKDQFHPDTLLGILRNEIYKGDRLLQKTPHTNYITHRPEKGMAYKSYYIEGNHEPIVSKELWDGVQMVLAAPKDRSKTRNKKSHCIQGTKSSL